MDNVKGKPRKQLCPLCLLVLSFHPFNIGHNSENSLSSIDGAAFTLKSVTKKFPSAFRGLFHSFIHHYRYAISHSATFLNNTVLKFAFLLCSHLRLGRPLRFFHCHFSTSFIWIPLLLRSFHILFPSYFPLLDHPNISTRKYKLWTLDSITSPTDYYSLFMFQGF